MAVRGLYIDRAVNAIRFIEDHRFWTMKDLQTHLGITKKNTFKYRDALSRHYPVRIVRYISNGGGTKPALYTAWKDKT